MKNKLRRLGALIGLAITVGAGTYIGFLAGKSDYEERLVKEPIESESDFWEWIK